MDEEIVIHSIDWNRQITLQWRDRWSDTYGIIINGVTYEEDDIMSFANSINNDPDCAATVHLEADGVTAVFTPKDPHELSEFWLDWVEGSVWTLVPDRGTPFWEAYNLIYSNYVSGGWTENKVRFPTNANLNGFTGISQPSRWNAYPIINHYAKENVFAANEIIQALDRTSGRATPRPQIRNNNSLAPYATLEYVLQRIEAFYDITIVCPFLGPENGKMIIDHPNTINRPVRYLGDTELTLYERSFNMATLVPDLKVNEFLKALQGLGYALDYRSSTRTLTFIKRDEVLGKTGFIDMSGTAGEIEDIQSQPAEGLTLIHKPDNGDLVAGNPTDANNGKKEYIIGDGKRVVLTEFHVPMVLDNTGRFPAHPIVPKVVATKEMSPDNDFPLRLAFSIVDANGIPSMQIANSEMGLSWFGFHGLANQAWKFWKELEAGKKTISQKLYLTDLQAFDPPWFEKILIDRNKYIISSLEFDTDEGSGWIECDAKLVRSDYSNILYSK